MLENMLHQLRMLYLEVEKKRCAFELKRLVLITRSRTKTMPGEVKSIRANMSFPW